MRTILGLLLSLFCASAWAQNPAVLDVGTLNLQTGAGTTAITSSAATTIVLPPNNGANGNFLTTDGNGNWTWSSGVAGTGTVTSGTAGQVAYYATSTNTVSGNANATVTAAGLAVFGGATAQTASSSAGSFLSTGTFDPANFPASGAVIVAGDTSAFKSAVEGISVNTLAGNPLNFPNAIAANGYLRSAGNNMFGFISTVNIYTTGNGSNEFDANNFSAAPNSTLPPNYAIGTPNSNSTGLYLGAGGTFNSTVALNIGSNGASPQSWLNGIYFNSGRVINNTIRDDSSSTNSIVINGSHTTGVHASAATFTGNAFDSPGFAVSGTGAVTMANTATATNIQGGVANTFIDSAGARSAGAPVTIGIVGSTFTANYASSIDNEITLVHASCPCTIASPLNAYAGLSGFLTITQSATGSDTISSWGSTWKFSGGTKPTLSVGANAVDVLPFYCRTPTFCVVNFVGNLQ